MYYCEIGKTKRKERKLSRKNNVDALAYTPLHVQVKRLMLAGEQYALYQHALNRELMYSSKEAFENDDVVPSVSPFPLDPVDLDKIREHYASVKKDLDDSHFLKSDLSSESSADLSADTEKVPATETT